MDSININYTEHVFACLCVSYLSLFLKKFWKGLSFFLCFQSARGPPSHSSASSEYFSCRCSLSSYYTCDDCRSLQELLDDHTRCASGGEQKFYSTRINYTIAKSFLDTRLNSEAKFSPTNKPRQTEFLTNKGNFSN